MASASAEDLIEVKKPTSLLIAQFFLFPLIIIAICVGIFLLFGYLTYEQQTPRDYLNDIRTGSETSRWQAAFELSNLVSSQKEKLLVNTDFVDSVVTLYQNSRNEDPRIRQFLALTMGHLGDPRTVPVLVEGLNDRQAENQIYTMWALGSIGDKSAAPAIVKKLHSEDPAVRKTAAYVLGSIKNPSATHDLQVALNDANQDVRWNAAMALARLNDASGADILMNLLDRHYLDTIEGLTPEQKTEVLINAVKCLGLLKFQPAQDKITTLSQHDSDLAVRDASLNALKSYETF